MLNDRVYPDVRVVIEHHAEVVLGFLELHELPGDALGLVRVVPATAQFPVLVLFRVLDFGDSTVAVVQCSLRAGDGRGVHQCCGGERLHEGGLDRDALEEILVVGTVPLVESNVCQIDGTWEETEEISPELALTVGYCQVACSCQDLCESFSSLALFLLL